MKTPKTNVARLLDSLKITYEVIQYEVDESDLSAIHVANQLNEPIDQVFKTLVLIGNKTGHFVCVIPGAKELDLKLAAKESGNKSCNMILMKDLLSTTGYIRGACSPIGMKKHFPTFIDKSCENFDFIYVSGGTRGLQVKINPKDLINITKSEATALTQ